MSNNQRVIYCSPRKFLKTFNDDFIYFLYLQSNCSHVLALLFAPLFFHFYSCIFFIDSFQNFSVLVLPLPHFHCFSLLYASLNVVQNCNLFHHHYFPLSFLIVIFILTLSEIEFILGSIYWTPNCRNTMIDVRVTVSGWNGDHDSVAALWGH